MKNLTELREELGGLCTQITKQIDDWIDSLDQLTAFMGGGAVKKRKYLKRANGATSPALRERVKAHFRQQRHIDVNYKPNPNNITIPEAAAMLGMSEAGFRWQINSGKIKSMKEVRDTKGPKHGVAYPREIFVVDRKAVEALKKAQDAGIQLSARQAKRGRPLKTARPAPAAAAVKPTSTAGKAAQRQRSADYLTLYDDTEPRTIPGQQLAPLVRRGYLKKKGDGYVRTGKPFVIQEVRVPTAVSVKARREATAVLLAKFDREEPRTTALADKPSQIGVLVQRGYLKKKNGGYVRTAKEFTA